MKVIVAGSPKTGTKSMNAALTELGYKVYDYLDHLFYLPDEWIKIFEGKGSIDDFKHMYKDIDAVVDMPACFYWQEIHKAFPDAKIILTTRDEESWLKSLKKQFEIIDKTFASFLTVYGMKFVPVLRKTVKYMGGYISEVSGMPMKINRFTVVLPINDMIAKKKFRERNEYILQAAPKDKLLVYDVRDGWEPLCNFLGHEIPPKPFPHKNIGGKLAVESADDHEYGRQAKKEFMISLAVFVLLIAISCYFLSNYSIFTQIFVIVFIIAALLFIF